MPRCQPGVRSSFRCSHPALPAAYTRAPPDADLAPHLAPRSAVDIEHLAEQGDEPPSELLTLVSVHAPWPHGHHLFAAQPPAPCRTPSRTVGIPITSHELHMHMHSSTGPPLALKPRLVASRAQATSGLEPKAALSRVLSLLDVHGLSMHRASVHTIAYGKDGAGDDVGDHGSSSSHNVTVLRTVIRPPPSAPPKISAQTREALRAGAARIKWLPERALNLAAAATNRALEDSPGSSALSLLEAEVGSTRAAARPSAAPGACTRGCPAHAPARGPHALRAHPHPSTRLARRSLSA